MSPRRLQRQHGPSGVVSVRRRRHASFHPTLI